MHDNEDRQWQRKRGKQIMENISDVLWESDARLLVTYVCPRDKEQRGYEPAEVRGKYWFAFLTDASQQRVMKAIADYARSVPRGNHSPLVLQDVQQLCKDGSVIWTDITLNPVIENGVLAGFVGATRDTTARKQAEARLGVSNVQIENLTRELERLSATDRLTGLFNRDKLAEIWNQEAARVKRYRISLSVVLINLDSFRQINETHGHVHGDAVLVDVARILERFIRDNDSVYRWGDDEFIFLLPHTTKDQGRVQAERLRQTIEQNQFSIPARVTMSAGVTEYIDGDTLESIVIRADKALYIAKRSGHNQVEVR